MGSFPCFVPCATGAARPRQWDLDDDPRRAETDFAGDQGRTYGEIYMVEIWQINEKLPTREQSLIVDAVPPATADAALASLPKRMWPYAYWIRDDFTLLLQKRLALGPAEGLLEDLSDASRSRRRTVVERRKFEAAVRRGTFHDLDWHGSALALSLNYAILCSAVGRR